jgi:hypothetical protein
MRELEKRAPVDQHSHPASILLAARPEFFVQCCGCHGNELSLTRRAQSPHISAGTRFVTQKRVWNNGKNTSDRHKSQHRRKQFPTTKRRNPSQASGGISDIETVEWANAAGAASAVSMSVVCPI